MKKVKLLIGIIVIFNFACEQKIDFPVPEGGAQRLIVDGSITDETKAHQVKLTYSSQFNSSIIPPVENALVQITDGTNRYLLQERGKGLYETDPSVKGEIGKAYTLEISLPNGEDYRAYSTMQPIGSIDSLRVELSTVEVEDEDEDEEFQEFYVIYANGLILSDYFMIHVEVNGQKYGTIRNVGYGDSKFLTNGQLIDGVLASVETDDANFVDGNNSVTIRMLSIDQDYREFLIGFGAQLYSGDDGLGGLFEGPAANVPGNINNGALGVFGAFAVAKRDITILK